MTRLGGRWGALLFDFDGVLVESEAAGNRQIAEWLTANGHPTTAADSMANFMGLSGRAFTDAIERWIGGPLPAGFAEARAAEDARALAEGVGAVAGAVAFVRSLPADLPRAIVSSSSTEWIAAHLRHVGLEGAFGDHLYSGREHVANGKPAPDLYLHAADRLGVTGAAKTGGYVIGLCAGTHCAAGHGDRLLALGADAVAADFGEVARLLGMDRGR